MKISPDQLVSFATVAELGSVSKSAKKLGISQPTLSNQLRLLQENFSDALYVRHAHGIRITPAGEEFLPFANEMIRSLRQAERYLTGQAQDQTVSVKLGMGNGQSIRSLELAQAAPKEKVELSIVCDDSESLVQSLRNNRIDGAILLRPEHRAEEYKNDFEVRRLGEDEMVAVLPKGHLRARNRYLPLSALREETFLWANCIPSSRLWAQELIGSAGLNVKSLELGSLAATLDAVADGHGVTVLPRQFVGRRGQCGEVEIVHLEEPLINLAVLFLLPHSSILGQRHQRLRNMVERVFGIS